MEDKFYWDVFKSTGSIAAYLLYRETAEEN